MSRRAEQLLSEILLRAIEGDADEVTLEYVPEGIEVMYCRGHSGAGYVVAERDLLSLVAARARRGSLRISVADRVHRIVVERYESFGETALRLRFGKTRRVASRRG